MNAGTPSSQEKAYRHLKSKILDLEYQPNARITANEIAQELEISRTPVREALGRLEQEGLVVSAGGWGYVVRPLSVKEALDLYKVREALEVEAVREALPNVTEPLLERLSACLDRAETAMRARRLGEFRRNTREFYRVIAKATNNACLEHMLALIDDRIRWLGALIADRHFDRPQESISDNRELLEALRRGDEAGAVRAIRQHVNGAGERLLGCVMNEKATLLA
ncbi:MAG TPA: GntR family transcriptional regulator [Burkholderiales bacterium]|nr:GntR family transcriptional regulator [Burkholderiales bacterium]